MGNELLSRIGKEFNVRYKKSEAEALEYYRWALLDSQGELVPDVIQLKDFATLILQILDYLKGMGSRSHGLSTEQILEATAKLLHMQTAAEKSGLDSVIEPSKVVSSKAKRARPSVDD